MLKTLRRALTLLACLTPVAASAQSLPTTQPNMITIVREDVKLGRDVDHQRIESGWPAAFDKAKSPDYYLALVSTTGKSAAWYVTAYESHKAIGDSMKREDADAALTAELARLRRADADVISSVDTIQAIARKDLSFGSYPDIGKQRFFEITMFRTRPGHELQFEAAARAFGSASKRAGTSAAYRVYEVIAGIPGPTYLVFSSVSSYGDFDQGLSDGEKTMKGASADESAALQKYMLEGAVNVETQRFRVDPVQSYVPKDTRAQDPAFWIPKKPAPAPKATQQ